MNSRRLYAAALLIAPLAHATAPGYGTTPLSFEQNRGQTASSVQFLARGSDYTTFLEPTIATLRLERRGRSRDGSSGNFPAPGTADAHEVLRMRLIGAARDAAMTGKNPLPGYVNYVSGADRTQWSVGLPTFAAAEVHGVYPGIDLVYYGTDRRLEYDFVVSPRAQAGQIRLTIDGAEPVVETNGELRLRSGKTARSTDVVFHKPVVYQQIEGRRRRVAAAFQIKDHDTVTFRLGAYDHSRELIIDPVISYAGYFGGAGEDEINGSALNASNQLYAVGQTHSATLPGATGEFQSARDPAKNSNYHDAFVTKFSADGASIVWTTYLSGGFDDFATAVAVNAQDQAYVVGYTQSCGAPNTGARFPFTADAVQTLCSPDVLGFNDYESDGSSYDAYLIKLSADGKSVLYGTPLGGSDNDFANSVALDAAGKVYIVGETYSTQYLYAVSSNLSDVPSYPVNNHNQASIGHANYPTTSTAFYTNTTESKLNSTADANGNVTGPKDEQAFLTILSADLHTIVYSSLIGGTGLGGCGNGDCNTNGIAVAVNAKGLAFIGGNTSSAHFPTTTGAFAMTCANAGAANSGCPMNGWVAAFDQTQSGAASLAFATYMTGTTAGTNGASTLYPGSDVYGLATDSAGNVVATGDTNANDFPTTTGVLQPACVKSTDGNGDLNVCDNAFVTKLSPTGTTLWSTYYHGTAAFTGGAFVVGNGVALDANDNVYIVGNSNVPSIPLKDAVASNATSQTDAFLIELSADATTLVAGTYLGSTSGVSVDNNSLHLDSALNAYFSGSQAPNPYGGTSFPTSTNAFDKTIQGSDGWVVKMATQPLAATVALTVAPNPAMPGANTVFTATVTGVAGSATPTGAVSFNNGTTALGTGTLTATGVATFTSTTLTAGTYGVIATYAGDGSYGTSSSTAVSVSVAAPAAPTVTIAAAPASITLGATSMVTWSSTNATACTASGSWTGAEGLTGSVSETPAAVGTSSYTLTCTGPGGSTLATATVAVVAPVPTVTLGASPASLTLGQTIALSWSSTNATACTASGAWSGTQATSGTLTESPAAAGTATYTLTCTGTGGSAKATATAAVAAVVTTTATPTPPNSGSHGGGGGIDLWSLGGLFALSIAEMRRRRGRTAG